MRHSDPKTGVQATATGRFLGQHDVTVEETHGRLRLTMPGLIVTLADARAAAAMFRSWAEAAPIAKRSFTGEHVAHHRYPIPAQKVTAAVLLEGRQPKPAIFGRSPEHSPSGTGQVILRVGLVTIVADDRAAWESQYNAWREMYPIAETLWKMPNRKQVEIRAEQRALARLTPETSPENRDTVAARAARGFPATPAQRLATSPGQGGDDPIEPPRNRRGPAQGPER